MPKETNIDFLSIIREVFDPIFKEFGLIINDQTPWDGRDKYSVSASNDSIDLIFYLGASQLYYHCSLQIKLTGEMANKATKHVNHRQLGVATIACNLDPKYEKSPKGAQTVEEVKAMLEANKDDLLKYCSDILSGDVSSWSRIADRLAID